MHLRVCLSVFRLLKPLYVLLSGVCADATLTVETQNWYCMSLLSSRIAQRPYMQKHLYLPQCGFRSVQHFSAKCAGPPYKTTVIRNRAVLSWIMQFAISALLKTITCAIRFWHGIFHMVPLACKLLHFRSHSLDHCGSPISRWPHPQSSSGPCSCCSTRFLSTTLTWYLARQCSSRLQLEQHNS